MENIKLSFNIIYQSDIVQMQAKMYSYQFIQLKLKYIIRSFFTIKFKSEKNKYFIQLEKNIKKIPNKLEK